MAEEKSTMEQMGEENRRIKRRKQNIFTIKIYLNICKKRGLRQLNSIFIF